MKSGKCVKCGSENVYMKQQELGEYRIDGRPTETLSYICTDCGFFETFVTDQKRLQSIVERAAKLGDWKKVR